MDPLTDALRRFRGLSFAKAVLVIDEDGDVVAGDSERDAPSTELPAPWLQQLGSLEGLARQMDSTDFGMLYRDVAGDDVHISLLTEDRILCILYSDERTSLGVVRLRLREHREELIRALAKSDGRSEQ